MTKKQKIMLVRILIAALLLVGLNFVPAEGWLRFVLYLIPYLVIGYDILLKAFKGIRNGQVFDECFLMAVATIGAIALALYERSGDYTEAEIIRRPSPSCSSTRLENGSRVMRSEKAAAISVN